MMVVEALRISAALGFLCFLAACAEPAGEQDPKRAPRLNNTAEAIFDGYRWGIHDFQLILSGDTMTLRRKDLSKQSWRAPVTADIAALGRQASLAYPSADNDFTQNLNRLFGMNASALDAISLSGDDALYVKYKTLREQALGTQHTASYWAEKDSQARTTDLIISEDGTIIGVTDPSKDIILVRRGYENFTVLKEWRDPNLSQPRYGYTALPKQMVPTKAGPKLATLVYLPEGDIEGPFPTIFIRTPYGISEILKDYMHYPIRGYALVLQAAQGTIHWDPDGRSEGAHQAEVNEPGDGADALSWITQQPRSNGSICMQGFSYLGYTQWAATMARNPALKCLVPEVSMGTAFSDQPYMGGTFVQGFAYYPYWMLGKDLVDGRTWSDVFRHRPISDMDRFATDEDIPYWNDLVENAANNEYWRGQNWYAGAHPRDFATLQISGWFDDDYPGTRSNWALMSKYGTRANRLILGPWRHDYHLKGIDNGVTDPNVEYFLLGANEWRTASAWPPAQADMQTYYFHSQGHANRFSDGGTLRSEKPAKSQPYESYVYDPKNAVKNWYNFDLMETWADYQSYPYDFKDIEARPDVVTFTTPPLEEDMVVAGNIKVVVYGSTDAKDTDWWAYIADVGPDYSSNRLSVGALRARFRQLDDPDTYIFGSNFETETLLSGDIEDVVRYEISIPSVANTFKKGRRLRIAIVHAHENYSLQNSNTG